MTIAVERDFRPAVAAPNECGARLNLAVEGEQHHHKADDDDDRKDREYGDCDLR